MKRPWRLLWLFVIVFTSGVLIGSVLQKYYRLGNLRRAIGIKNDSSFAFPRVIFEHNAGAQTGISEEFSGKLSLFILAGQSNMSGRGDVPSQQSIHSRIFVFGNDYRWKIAREPTDAAEAQVDLVSEDKGAGFGPGLAFAIALIKRNPDRAIGLIPCAKGGSSIQDWQRSLSEDTLYGSCLKRIRAASTVGRPAGMLFFQGETDALDPKRYSKKSPSAPSYAVKFTTFIEDLRRDVFLPRMPIVFAQIGTHEAPEDYVNWELVKKQQEKISLPCTAMITTGDLALNDGVHFTTDSYRIIGERYADAFIHLMATPNDCARTR
jgi:Carbohydrate esterase, sialic acid-specific acetylesterase